MWVAWWWSIGCERGPVRLGVPEDTAATGETGTTGPTGPISASDQGLASGYVDLFLGHLSRGRGATVVDLDGDGDRDVISTNPGDGAFVIRNVTPPGGPLRFELGQALETDGDPWWTVGAGDWDNDGDPDLFVGYGGNEGTGFDHLLRNDLRADRSNADAPLVDVTEASGVVPRRPDGTPVRHATAGALFLDYDGDALLDVYASDHVQLFLLPTIQPQDVIGINHLWRGRGDGTFESVERPVGLLHQQSTRHSVFVDFDRDGDLDLFENNFVGPNVLWRNRLAETGSATFEDATAEASLGGGDLAWPMSSGSMCAIPADLDNDGWEDLVVFRRGQKEQGEPAAHDLGHLVWMNVGGAGFVEVASRTDLNADFVYRDHGGLGVMGCQVADWNADGYPDLFVGNGGPDEGERNQLFLSRERTLEDLPGVGTVAVPRFDDASALIAGPAELPADYTGPVPPYPYRTHGSAAGDFDGDGYLELAEHNGGPSTNGTDAEMQEPNRLWKFDLPDRPHWLEVSLVGDGIAVNRDAVGARVRLTVSDGGEARDLYQVRHTQTGFAAQNQGELFFGLGRADTVTAVEVTWPDGRIDTLEPPAGVDRRIRIDR